MADVTLIGRAMNFDGSDILIHREEHERKLPNGEYESYTVSSNNAVQGFKNQSDMETYLYSNPNKDVQFDSEDRDGEVTSRKVRPLGLVKQMVANYDKRTTDTETPTANNVAAPTTNTIPKKS